MSVRLTGIRDFQFRLGSVTMHMSAYQVTGSCTVRETGTPDGGNAVTALWRKGTRLTLKGKLEPDVDTMQAAAAMDAVLRSGEKTDMVLSGVSYRDLRLIGYTLSDARDTPEVTLIFLTQGPLKEDRA